jgi:hypothetical protein
MSNYYPTPLDANRIVKLKRAGILNFRIAEIMKMTIEDLEKFFPVELGFTDEEDLADVAEVALNMAKSGVDSKMTQWWLAVKGGWNVNAPLPTNDQSPLMIVLADGTEFENESTKSEVIDGDFARLSDDDEDSSR